MNTEKLKAHECRFCKSMTDNGYCVRTKEDCRYLYIAEDFRKGLPDLWEPHHDIAEAMPETTELERILCAAIWYKELQRNTPQSHEKRR